MRDFDGRVAVVTGGGAGLGAALARRFAAEGMKLVVADIAAGNAEAVAASLRREGARAVSCGTDVGDAKSLEALARFTEAELGACHVLCANVGVQRIGKLDELGSEDWEWLLRVNVLGTVQTVVSLLPLMRRSQGERHIVVTSSLSGLLAAPRLGAYTATKFAITGYTETLRLELADEGIGVTLLLPAGMTTTHLASSAAARPAALGHTPDPNREDLEVVAAATAPGPRALLPPDEAIRDLIPALRENRPYLVTHAPQRAEIEARFESLVAALRASGGGAAHEPRDS